MADSRQMFKGAAGLFALLSFILALAGLALDKWTVATTDIGLGKVTVNFGLTELKSGGSTIKYKDAQCNGDKDCEDFLSGAQATLAFGIITVIVAFVGLAALGGYLGNKLDTPKVASLTFIVGIVTALITILVWWFQCHEKIKDVFFPNTQLKVGDSEALFVVANIFMAITQVLISKA
eukprot:TRINITY_DN147_c0_g1_i1.p1 TRINITY_DN147_c0_g1~~TRINITY_DN147_c0_g1_i1.p1  ORF type:complete len:185 (-),score=41.72 TRINITY_DN147_c0_g1_i1:47-580(-)